MCVDSDDRILSVDAGMPNFHSLHAKIEVTYKSFLPSHTTKPFTYRDFKRITREQLIYCLNGCDWTACMRDGVTPDSILDCISENLREAIKQLAPEKTVIPKKKRPPWINTEFQHLQLLIDTQNHLRRCCGRNGGSDILWTELNKVCNETETKTETARNAYLQARMGDDNKKKMWKELRHLGLLPGTEDALRGFSPDELNAHFAGVSVSPLQDIEDVSSIYEELWLVSFPSGQLALEMWNSQLNPSPRRLVARMAFDKL